MRTIEYMRRKNIGNYAHEELRITDVVQEGEEINKKISDLKELVLTHLGLVETQNAPKAEPQKSEEKPQTLVKEKKNEKAAKEVVREEVVNEESDEEKGDSEQEESNEESSPKEKVKAPRKPETTRKGRIVSKNTHYDRTLDTHKALLGTLLDTSLGKGWRAGALLKKAGAASVAMHEEKADFLDGNGEILDSFKEKFLKLVQE